MRVGWIGLGAMGLPMATVAVRAGLAVAGYDVNPVAVEALAGVGGTAGDGPAGVARDADVLVVMVATPAQVRAALFDSGAADALPAGSTVLLMATVGPDPVQAWAEELDRRGVGLVDAPVSGGVARAGAGDLLIMASGTADALAAAGPLLDALGRERTVVGPRAGDGQRVKLVNQLLCGVHIAAAGEALAFAESLGLDARACWEVIRHGAAASFMLDDRGERMLDGTDRVRSAVDIFVKDMGLVVRAAGERLFPAPLARVAEQLYLSGARAGLGPADDSSIIDVLRGRLP